jgi:hypothetical protein
VMVNAAGERAAPGPELLEPGLHRQDE